MADYYYEDEGMKKHMEGLIPIVILVLIGIVLVGKTTDTFCAVPGLNQVLCSRGGNVMIGVIGDFESAETNINGVHLQGILNSDGPKYNIYWRPINQQILEWPREKLLADFDAVLLVGEKDFSYAVRDAIGNYIAGGGNVIIIGDAATSDPKDPLICGWSSGALGNYAPVRMSPIGMADNECGKPKTIGNPQISFWSEHPILRDVAEQYNLDLMKVNKETCNSIDAIDVVPRNDLGAETIAILSDGADTYVPGIVEKSTPFGGKVLYFNYDPGCTWNVAFATIRYMSGA